VSLVVDVVLAAGGVAIGRWLARTWREGDRARPVAAGEGETRPPERAGNGNFPCDLGDVVVRVMERDEAWLAGALSFSEDGPIAALFVAPEAGADRAVFAREGEDGLLWLGALPAGEITPTQDPPHALEHGGAHFERLRRWPVGVRRLGTGVPTVGEKAILAEYAGPGEERLLVVAGADRTMGWRGVALRRADYDVLPGSKRTVG